MDKVLASLHSLMAEELQASHDALQPAARVRLGSPSAFVAFTDQGSDAVVATQLPEQRCHAGDGGRVAGGSAPQVDHLQLVRA